MTDTAALAEAAEKLRRLAAAVSAPDERDQTFHAEGTDITQGRAPGMYDVAVAQTGELAAYIAALAPTVGLALADWLGCLAMHEPAERSGGECAWCGDNHAETVARALTQPTA